MLDAEVTPLVAGYNGTGDLYLIEGTNSDGIDPPWFTIYRTPDQELAVRVAREHTKLYKRVIITIERSADIPYMECRDGTELKWPHVGR